MKRKIGLSTAFVLAIVSGVAVPSARGAEADGIRVSFPEKVVSPSGNPQTPEKVELGKKLFFDPRFSRNNKISCNSCHNVLKTGDDGLPRSPGHEGKLGGRNSPTVFNSAFSSVQFWDGRAPSLEEQAKGPIINPLEMGMVSHDKLIELISKVPAYKEEFEKAFGPGPITLTKMVQAIAAFERTLITPGSPYDRFVAGDAKALSASARRGMMLVETVGCTSCHSGAMFNGPALPMGTGFYQKFPVFPGSEYEKKYRLAEDTGRHAETKKESDRNMWRVPTWRNIAITAPYFHTGSVARLDEAVRVMAKTQLNKTLPEQDVQDITAFLKSLTGRRPKIAKPTLPPAEKTSSAAGAG